ncbi:hypothetical protein J2Y66_000707 [Paenarthrobacter nitroguajacolicus]|nr:hypothetical protein [Paenarthrobacter nitroguajacolicus]
MAVSGMSRKNDGGASARCSAAVVLRFLHAP